MITMPKTSTEYDVVLWGATGFTGRLVAEHLARTQREHGARWAIAGRDRGKLERVRGEIAREHAAAADLPILVGDARDAASLDAIVGKTRVVCTTVGPFARYGSELVAACARGGTDYCDITGEVHWMRRMIDAHHARARETGARIVHTCGFDSIPSDLGVLVLQEHMREQHDGRCHSVHAYAGESRGGPSGGTIASMLETLDEAAKDRSLRRLLADPYALDPEPRVGGPDGPDQRAIQYSEELGRWTGPFVMAVVNTRVVRRSNALLGYPYGRDFHYSEAMSFPPGPKGLAMATGMVAGLGAFVAATRVPPLRRLLEERVLPKPGEGPSAEQREHGYFVMRMLGEGTSGKTGRTVRLLGKIAGEGDPGYAATSRMLGESALCLAQDDVAADGGVLTPASSMGMKLVTRLRNARIRFDVEERDGPMG